MEEQGDLKNGAVRSLTLSLPPSSELRTLRLRSNCALAFCLSNQHCSVSP